MTVERTRMSRAPVMGNAVSTGSVYVTQQAGVDLLAPHLLPRPLTPVIAVALSALLRIQPNLANTMARVLTRRTAAGLLECQIADSVVGAIITRKF